MPGKSKTYYPKWWFDGGLPLYKVKDHLKQIQVLESIQTLLFKHLCGWLTKKLATLLDLGIIG